MTIKLWKVGGKTHFNSLYSDFFNIVNVWIWYFCYFKISNLHEIYFDYVNPSVQPLTLCGHDKIISHMNSHHLHLYTQDLHKIKAVNTQHNKRRASKSPSLAEELLIVNGFWERESVSFEAIILRRWPYSSTWLQTHKYMGNINWNQWAFFFFFKKEQSFP